MADDIEVTPGSGAVVATDEVSSRHYQLVKPAFGADGSATLVSGSNPLPVGDTSSVFTGSASSATTIVGPVDSSSYSLAVFQISGTFSASVHMQGSFDSSTWTSIAHPSATTSSPAYAFNNTNPLTAGGYWMPVMYPYMRIQVTSYTSGTVNASLWLSRGTPPLVAVTGISSPAVSVSAFGSFTVVGSQSAADGQTWASSAVPTTALGCGFNGATWDRLRTPITFKSVETQATGDTALWTPTSSKKFRLMRYKVAVTHDAAQSSGGRITIGFKDSATTLAVAESVFVPGTAATTMGEGWSSDWVDLGNGILSAVANNVLYVTLSAALTSGYARVLVAGTEE